MRKILAVLMCGVMLAGCGSNNAQESISEKEADALIESEEETISEAESVDGFEKADYDKYNSYASENGLDGTLIYVDCTIDSMIEVNGIVALLLNDSGNEENKWILSFSEPTYMIKEQVDSVIEKEVRVFGEYVGKSKLLQMPALTIVDEDMNYYIELDDGTKLTWMDFFDIHSYINDLELGSEQEVDESEYTASVDCETEAEIETGTLEQEVLEHEVTMGERNALRSAQSYLDVMAFSYIGLVEQLEYEGYSKEEATYAADNCGADWKEQAAKSAKNYLDVMAFSRDGLVEQLEFDGFTHEQAVYGVEQNGY